MRCRTAVLAAALAVAMTGCAVSAQSSSSPHPHGREADCGNGKCLYLGVAAVRVSALPAFEHQTGVKPTMVENYMTFGTPVNAVNIAAIMTDGAMPLIQLNPFNFSLAAIASGRYDGYLERFGTTIGQIGQRVVVSFAAEANGTWYGWSCHHTSAATYVAAWRHVHNVVSRYDKNSVIWMWDVNVNFPGSCALAARWPGAAYVNWVGVDGYLRHRSDTFATVIAPTITTLRASTGKPVLIAETGVPDVPQAAPWLRSIFAGAESIPGVIGLVYFDYASHNGDYNLQQDPSALAVFSREAKIYQSIK
jgi:mannan endo-1,4-beta-mannosidase